MKKIITLFSFTILLASCDILSQIGLPLSQADVANGLKEALIQGVNRGGTSLFSTNTNGNSGLLNELLPANVASLLGTARQLGLGGKIDNVTNKLNTAAVNSAQKAMPIFISAIRGMNISDAFNILRGDKNAATAFLRNATAVALTAAIKPEVNGVFSSLGLQPTLLGNLGAKNPLLSGLDVDLSGMLSQMVCNKMYAKIEQEEAKVRANVGDRTTALMQRVFAPGALNNIIK
jgi:Protein of unknown function (DUF4197)